MFEILKHLRILKGRSALIDLLEQWEKLLRIERSLGGFFIFFVNKIRIMCFLWFVATCMFTTSMTRNDICSG